MKQTDDIYIYQDTFLSLLCLCKKLIELRVKPVMIKNTEYPPNLLNNIISLELNGEENIIDYFLKYISKSIIKTCYYVFLSNDENKELVIFYFIVNTIKYPGNIYYMRNLKCVDSALRISKRVSHEVHRFKGFIRFRELDKEILYAEFEPCNDILYLLSIHFSKRLKNENWIINDKKRKLLSVYDKKKFNIIENTNIRDIKLAKNEEYFEKLWKDFYNTIGIEERKNERCRMNFMPKKYWKNILEMEQDNEKNS